MPPISGLWELKTSDSELAEKKMKKRPQKTVAVDASGSSQDSVF